MGIDKGGKVISYPDVQDLKKATTFADTPSTPASSVRQSGKLSLSNKSNEAQDATQLSDTEDDDESRSDYQAGKDEYENESLELASSKRFHRRQLKD